MEEEIKKLVMRFEAHTIEHLGVKMYSHTPPAIAELIANSYDACARIVNIRLYDGEQFRIEVEDNGDGMTFEEVNDHFLRIGRNRRKEKQLNSCERKPTGKKGLGKLALFGLGNKITIITKKEKEQVKFTLNYSDILEWNGTDYTPKFEITKIGNQTGTIIVLEELKRRTNYPLEDYARSISKLFNFKDKDFKVLISLNDGEPIEIHNKLKYDNITPQFEWKFDEIKNISVSDYEEKGNIEGKLITTEKPLKPGLRGITLFANGRLVNSAEFFGRSESSHFYSYLTGWLDVDFIDNYQDDYISTDRQSLNWENEVTNKLKIYLSETLKALEKLWRNKRKELKQEKIKEITNVDVSIWLKNVPDNIRALLEPVLEVLDDSELTAEEQTSTVQNLHTMVPDYPYFHWRQLHVKIQDASEEGYKNKDYYKAFLEAAKRYANETRTKSGSTSTDQGMMGEVYGAGKIISVCGNYKKTDGTDFTDSTIRNIEEGQKLLSMGIVSGGRNPLSHEEIKELRDSDLFSEKDCLDGLSLLSHLMKRLDNSV
ncbi:MAG: TIGR02391 family protein [Ignavibacteriae bacterium]|nr:TIGR02391 family protein [Ignavibacteriota bacterium]